MLYRAVDLKDLSTYAMFNRAVAYIAGIKLQRAQKHEPKPTQHEYVLYYFIYISYARCSVFALKRFFWPLRKFQLCSLFVSYYNLFFLWYRNRH